MLACNRALWQKLPAPQERSAAQCSESAGGAQCARGADAWAIGARLRAAGRVLGDDPDAAALLLDGAIAAMAALWLAAAGLDLPAPALQPALVERDDPLVGLRLRQALRARNVEARLEQCRELLRLIEDRAGGEHHVG